MNRAALVVFGWAAFNALLTIVLVIYSARDPFPLIVYSFGVVLVGGFGTIVLLAARRGRTELAYRTATRSTSAAFLSIAAALIGLGFVYGWFLMLIALYPLVMAGVLVRGERVGRQTVPDERITPAQLRSGQIWPQWVPAELGAPARPIEQPRDAEQPSTQERLVDGEQAPAPAARARVGMRTALAVLEPLTGITRRLRGRSGARSR